MGDARGWGLGVGGRGRGVSCGFAGVRGCGIGDTLELCR